MSAAPKSITEWPASERMASEPDRSPTAALAKASPPDAKTDPSATFSLLPCMAVPRRCRRSFTLPQISAGFLQGVAIFAHEPRAQIRGRRHVVDAADALPRRPDVFPGAFFVLADRQLLVRCAKVDFDAGGLDARPQEIAVHAADRGGVDDVLGAARKNHVLEFLRHDTLAGGDEARAEIGKIGADHARGGDVAAGRHHARQQNRLVEKGANFRDERKRAQQARVSAGAGANGDQSIDARLRGLARMANVAHVVKDEPAIALHFADEFL